MRGVSSKKEDKRDRRGNRWTRGVLEESDEERGRERNGREQEKEPEKEEEEERVLKCRRGVARIERSFVRVREKMRKRGPSSPCCT